MPGFHEHLGHIAVDLLHRFEVHAVTRHLGRFLVLREYGGETLRITLRLGHDPRLVCGSLFIEPSGRSDGARNDIIGIGLRFILRTLALLPFTMNE